jgi:hypothetical protein
MAQEQHHKNTVQEDTLPCYPWISAELFDLAHNPSVHILESIRIKERHFKKKERTQICYGPLHWD